jgi:glyoxylase-like metal-dependent hydrolase (beta-lactamase superfamily II)
VATSLCGSPAAIADAVQTGQILPGLWRFEARHPEWTEDEGGGDGWDPLVAWWAVASSQGLLLIDPLVDAWASLDGLVEQAGGCAGVIRTCHWHQRTIGEASARYSAPVWAQPPGEGVPRHPYDIALRDGDELLDGITATDVERDDEVALWLPEQRGLVFGDAMIRRSSGELRVCPDSWTQPDEGPERLRAILRALSQRPVEHVLVSHGPLVLGDGAESLHLALA